MPALYDLIRPMLFRMDPEKVHDGTLRALGKAGRFRWMRRLLRGAFAYSHPSLRVRALGLDFPNPLGLAAGYDKDGSALPGLSSLGFGHVELGTVTPLAQRGNPMPRIFRLEKDEALINRMGFPNQGAAELLAHLQRRHSGEAVVGVNIGKGAATPLERAAQDYRSLLRAFHPLADYVAVNVSSPNTIGLRRLQAREHLEALLDELSEERAQLQSLSGKRIPMLIKLSPDLDEAELEDALGTIVSHGMDGVIATNTTLAREGLKSLGGSEAGGLSGAPLRQRALEVVRRMRVLTGDRLCIIGVGGIARASHAYEMLQAGANLVQVYTGLVYRGPGMVRAILRGLGEREEPAS
jgi:dihydroorotate dehydrogenase